MLKKIFSIFLVFVFCYFPVHQALAQDDDENIEKGGLAICKLIGGKEKVTGNFRIKENSILLDNNKRELEVDLEGDITSAKGERSLTSEVEVSNVDSSTFKVGKVLKTTASNTELVVKVEEGDKEFAIIALAQSASGSPLVSSAKLLLTSIKNKKIGGVTTVNYPRTVMLPIDSPEFIALENAMENDKATEIDLSNATENGSVVLTCRFRDLPFTLIE